MDFSEIIELRQSCRNFDPELFVDERIIKKILDAALLAPSACNGQPYHFTVCTGEAAKQVAKATTTIGMNKFTLNAPVIIVISEEDYVKTAALGAKLKGNDYRSIDIGIASAYLTSAATELGVESCIIGWFDDKKIRDICSLDKPVRLVVALGYANKDDKLRPKKRKDFEQMVDWKK